ncbi:MAG: threonine/serine exporter ThrE family protein [Roseburia sp.]
MAQTKEILTLAVELADTMLRSGAEIYRVEDSVIRILEAYGLKDADVYVLSNGIFASANENKEDACSMIRHVPLASVHLSRVAALNQLTRDICDHKCTIEEANVRLQECRHLPSYPPVVLLLCCGLACAAFAFLFGGNIIEALFSFAIGVVEQLLLLFCKKHKVSRFLTNVYASVLISLLSILIVITGLPVHHDKLVIATIMPIVPGIVFTTAIRDFYNEDYLSGSIHLIDALLTALCIAVGVSLPIVLFRYLGGLVL